MSRIGLIQKLQRKKTRGRIKDPNIDLRQEVLADSPKLFNYLRGIQRRFDRFFGTEVLAGKVGLQIETAGTLERVDFGTSDFGLKLTLPEKLVTYLIESDVVWIRDESSQKEGSRLAVVSKESLTEIRLPDDSGFAGTETDIVVRLQYSTYPAV